jgi:uncharacterized protein (TIGR02284 family)
MEPKDIISKLINLAKVDIDAAYAYEQALENVEWPEMHEQLKEYQQDHMRHVNELSAEIINLGGDPPKRSLDFKGFFISGFTALRSISGTKGALKAMKNNESLTNSAYEKALEENFPGPIQTLLLRNLQDEKRHMAFIQSQINVLKEPSVNL